MAAAALADPLARALFADGRPPRSEVSDDEVADYHARNPLRFAASRPDPHGWRSPSRVGPPLEQVRVRDRRASARRRAAPRLPGVAGRAPRRAGPARRRLRASRRPAPTRQHPPALIGHAYSLPGHRRHQDRRGPRGFRTARSCTPPPVPPPRTVRPNRCWAVVAAMIAEALAGSRRRRPRGGHRFGRPDRPARAEPSARSTSIAGKGSRCGTGSRLRCPVCRCGWAATGCAWPWASIGAAPDGVRVSCWPWWYPPVSAADWCSTARRMPGAPAMPATSVTWWSSGTASRAHAGATAVSRRSRPGHGWCTGRGPTVGPHRRAPARASWPTRRRPATRSRCRRFGRGATGLAMMIASVAAVCDLDLVIVGGGVAKSGHVLFDPLRAALAGYAGLDFLAGLRVVPAELGGNAGLVGAARLAGTYETCLAGHRRHLRSAVLADRALSRYPWCRSTEDRRSPSNRSKVREHPGGPRRRTRHYRRRSLPVDPNAPCRFLRRGVRRSSGDHRRYVEP